MSVTRARGSRRRLDPVRCLVEPDYELVSDRGGIVFRGFPIESSSRALKTAGLAIEALREPPLPGVESYRRIRVPLLRWWRAVESASRG